MRILLETSKGGAAVLGIGLLLLWAHGGGSGASDVVIALVVALIVVVVAALGIGGYFVCRAMRQERAAVSPAPPRVLRAEVLPDAARPVLEAPAVRLHPEQLEQLAELIRRSDERR